MKTLAFTFLTAALAASCLAAPAPFSSPLDTAKTVQVTVTTTVPGKAGKLLTVTRVIKRAPGNLERMNYLRPRMAPVAALVSNGKILYAFNLKSNTYYKQLCSPSTLAWRPADDIVQGGMWPPTGKPQAAILDGKPMRLYTLVRKAKTLNGEPYRSTDYLWLDARTGLPYCQTTLLNYQGQTREAQHNVFTNWVLNAPLSPSTFQFTPPAGAKEVPK